jgi:hypothetical protein
MVNGPGDDGAGVEPAGIINLAVITLAAGVLVVLAARKERRARFGGPS